MGNYVIIGEFWTNIIIGAIRNYEFSTNLSIIKMPSDYIHTRCDKYE